METAKKNGGTRQRYGRTHFKTRKFLGQQQNSPVEGFEETKRNIRRRRKQLRGHTSQRPASNLNGAVAKEDDSKTERAMASEIANGSPSILDLKLLFQ